MKKIQSVLCALALAISLSSTVLAGDIHGVSATAPGDIHGVKAPGDIHGILVSDLFTWSDLTDVIVSIFGDIHG